MEEIEEVITWWKLAIELVVNETQCDQRDLIAASVAGEIYARFYSLAPPPFEQLVKACNDYLQRHSDNPAFAGPTPLPLGFNVPSNASEETLVAIVNAKSILLNSHIEKMDAYACIQRVYNENPSEFD
jgi:hypothetical protein